MNEKVISLYREMIRTSDEELSKYAKLVNNYSLLRLVAILGGGLMIWQTFGLEKVWITELSFFVVIILFAWLVSKQSRFERIRQFYSSLKKVNENEVNSILTHGNIYSDGSVFAEDKHPYSSDLDILGKSSLFNLINRCSTYSGCRTLSGWLLTGSSKPVILERQMAVKEISEKVGWKMKFQAVLLFANTDAAKDEISGLLRYFEEKSEQFPALLVFYVQNLPWILAGIVAISLFFPPALFGLLAFVLINAFVVLSHQSKVNTTERMIGKVGVTLHRYADAFKMLEEERWESPLCSGLCRELVIEGSKSLSGQIKRLSVLLSRLEYRLNMFIGPVLNFILAWDVRQLLALERWKSENRELVTKSFDVLATMEALISISGIHINYPEWTFPEIAEHVDYSFDAKALGHPLISPGRRVANDFSLRDTRKIDIITGSNMAGKSTFLRTLGINAVLALSGAPVCAEKMLLTPMKIFTYMRIRDSLNESISTFRAELNRLQMLLDEIKAGGKLYFLIDEMLRGTNSADKYKGSRAIIEKLIADKAVGVVATHDLQIADLENSYPGYIRNFYFDIKVQGNEMQFDYKLKNGACKTFNASLLLKQLGVEIGD